MRAVRVEVIRVGPLKLVGPGQKPYGLEKSIRVNGRNSFVKMQILFSFYFVMKVNIELLIAIRISLR